MDKFFPFRVSQLTLQVEHSPLTRKVNFLPNLDLSVLQVNPYPITLE